MTKTFTLFAAACALAAPAAASATDTAPAPKSSASSACKALQKSLGAATFKATYGTNGNKSNAFGKCVSARTKVERTAHTNAAKTCKAEEAADPAAFAAKYGTGKKGKNAFGKCVSALAKAASEQATKNTLNAAKACKAERKADAAAFKAKYGTNKSKSNAFGKCVSAKVRSPYVAATS
jgi:hypothetical protein